MVKFLRAVTALFTAVKYIWTRGSPFAIFSALWPTNEDGKYIIQAEGIRLALTNHGAAPTNLWMNNTYGQEIDIILGLDSADGYPKLPYNPFLNGVIGRYAGFMSGASYEHEGRRVQLAGNAHNGTSLLNGGDEGWGRQTWEVAVRVDNSITFLLFDRMWGGFPGVFAACVTHTVTANEWTVAFGVTPLVSPSPLDLSQAVFFNLDGFAAAPSPGKGDDGDGRRRGGGNVLGHTLHMPLAGMRFGVDPRGIPTGDILSNSKGGAHDFWSSPDRTVGDGLRLKNSTAGFPRHCPAEGGRECGYDETFLLSNDRAPGKTGDQALAVLSSRLSGITMELYADRDALHVQTWNQGDGALKLKKTQGAGQLPQHGAISIEMQGWPDAVNHPEWRNKKIMYGMDSLYTGFATYKFSVGKSSNVSQSKLESKGPGT